MRFYAVLFTLLAFSPIVYSKTIKVPADYTTIQAAIDAAVDGDLVLVDPNTYKENIDFKGKAVTVRSTNGASVTVIDGQQLGTVATFVTDEGPDSVLDGFTLTKGGGVKSGGAIFCDFWSSPTIINNIISDNSATQKGGGIGCRQGSSAVIKGNVIEGNSAFVGGGIHCGNGWGAPLIENNLIRNNTASSEGGGIAVEYDGFPTIRYNEITNNTSTNGSGGGISCTENAAPLITCNNILENQAINGGGIHGGGRTLPIISNNIISNNKAQQGGGLSGGYDADLFVYGNLISHNTATIDGGAAWVTGYSHLELKDNILDGNIANNKGGGVNMELHCSLQASNNIFCTNSAGEDGGAIYVDTTQCKLANNTLVENSAEQRGGGVFFIEGLAFFDNCVLWNNVATDGKEIYLAKGHGARMDINYSDVEGGQASVHVEPGAKLNWGPGMIDADPLFVESAKGDYHILYTSPCRDAGDNKAVVDYEDFEGDPRIAGGTADIGADEFHRHLYWTGDATPGGNVEIKFVGLPGTAPVDLCIGTGVLDPPIKSMWGDWYLQFPMIGPMDLGSITSPEGVLVVPGIIPAAPPPPYSIPMQALIGAELTNLSMLEIK